MSEVLIKQSDVIEAIHSYWKEQINKLPVVECEYGEVITEDGWKLLGYNKELSAVIKAIPSADRPQGEWKSVKASIYPYGYDVECSVCGHRMGSSFGYKFCPHCGAHMKGADDEADNN